MKHQIAAHGSVRVSAPMPCSLVPRPPLFCCSSVCIYTEPEERSSASITKKKKMGGPGDKATCHDDLRCSNKYTSPLKNTGCSLFMLWRVVTVYKLLRVAIALSCETIRNGEPGFEARLSEIVCLLTQQV